MALCTVHDACWRCGSMFSSRRVRGHSIHVTIRDTPRQSVTVRILDNCNPRARRNAMPHLILQGMKIIFYVLPQHPCCAKWHHSTPTRWPTVLRAEMPHYVTPHGHASRCGDKVNGRLVHTWSPAWQASMQHEASHVRDSTVHVQLGGSRCYSYCRALPNQRRFGTSIP